MGIFGQPPSKGGCPFTFNLYPMATYLIIGRDGTDENALDRRMTHRPDHIAGAKELKENGHFILGGAMLTDDGQMIGSALVVSFDDPKDLQDWLDREPYISGKVWTTYEVFPFKLANV